MNIRLFLYDRNDHKSYEATIPSSLRRIDWETIMTEGFMRHSLIRSFCPHSGSMLAVLRDGKDVSNMALVDISP